MKKEMESRLLDGLRRQDPRALEEAIDRFSPYVAGVARRVLGRLGTREDLEELTSDVFVALWRNGEALRPDSNLKLWLGVVARNRALKHLRLELPLEEAVLTDGEEGLLWERREEAQQVRRAVLSMEPLDREIFLRHYFWRQTVDRIAKELEQNPSTVKSRLKRGRQKLRAFLEKEEEA